ncbi:uncharacterized protein BDV17DRAFT_257681, partial [Aspergillus undulatus]|uniref:uncharacterized protein n=1 Tax=Aspergillus undulatus TaxID=1810928 RepID=UPI003CCD3D75
MCLPSGVSTSRSHILGHGRDSGSLGATWEQIIEARYDVSDPDYDPPPIFVFDRMDMSLDITCSGHHHLGILYPFNEPYVRSVTVPDAMKSIGGRI